MKNKKRQPRKILRFETMAKIRIIFVASYLVIFSWGIKLAVGLPTSLLVTVVLLLGVGISIWFYLLFSWLNGVDDAREIRGNKK